MAHPLFHCEIARDVVINTSYLVLVGQCPFELLIYYPVGMDTLVRERMVRYGRLYCYA